MTAEDLQWGKKNGALHWEDCPLVEMGARICSYLEVFIKHTLISLCLESCVKHIVLGVINLS